MKYHHRLLDALVLTPLLVICSSTPALAYVDPGTGAMLLQMMLAAVGAAIFYFRSTISRITRLLHGSRSKDVADAQTKTDSES